jgi:hypothetical protein
MKSKRYEVCFNEWTPFEGDRTIRTEVDISSNKKEEALKYISDVCSEKGFGEPNFIKVGRGVYRWTVDQIHDFTCNFDATTQP